MKIEMSFIRTKSPPAPSHLDSIFSLEYAQCDLRPSDKYGLYCLKLITNYDFLVPVTIKCMELYSTYENS